jgi:hypothetical protein
MEELSVLAEIEYTQKITSAPAAIEPSIWRHCFYATGPVLLSGAGCPPDLRFMADTFNRKPIKVTNFIIDQVEYTQYGQNVVSHEHEEKIKLLGTLTSVQSGWVNCGAVVYFRNKNYNPPHTFYSTKYGVLVGFTNNKPELINDLMYLPAVLSATSVEQTADTLTFNRMKFNSANISIDNTDGRFDDAENLFGNEFNLRAGIIEEEKPEPRLNIVKLIEDTENERVLSMHKETDEYVTLIRNKKAAGRVLRKLEGLCIGTP